eukprot:GHRQ01034689.1.p2 GENE.GHRQ01034689.1~~GHRQ01034689.1.p2  ORF type:complete len:164 (-),score=14.77 GHRQ01034689.1:95-586(-)
MQTRSRLPICDAGAEVTMMLTTVRSSTAGMQLGSSWLYRNSAHQCDGVIELEVGTSTGSIHGPGVAPVGKKGSEVRVHLQKGAQQHTAGMGMGMNRKSGKQQERLARKRSRSAKCIFAADIRPFTLTSKRETTAPCCRMCRCALHTLVICWELKKPLPTCELR